MAKYEFDGISTDGFNPEDRKEFDPPLAGLQKSVGRQHQAGTAARFLDGGAELQLCWQRKAWRSQGK